MVFRLDSLRAEWITLALQTIGHQHRDLRRVSIHMPPSSALIAFLRDIRKAIQDGYLEQISNLDLLLIHLWEARSIRPIVICPLARREVGVVDCVGTLLPDMTRRGMIEFIG